MFDNSAKLAGSAVETELQLLPGLGNYSENGITEGRKIGSDLATDLTSMRQSDIPLAIDHLDAVMQATECAANQIMDACNALEAAARDIGGDAAEAIAKAVTVIYEACSFQDLTGQRIVNVANTLGLIEGKLGDIALMVGIFAKEVVEPPAPRQQEMLVGPQRPEHAIDQGTVDRLLAQAD
jgi:chemotaxis protein CheZ